MEWNPSLKCKRMLLVTGAIPFCVMCKSINRFLGQEKKKKATTWTLAYQNFSKCYIYLKQHFENDLCDTVNLADLP